MTLEDLILDITDWHIETYGPKPSNHAMGRKLIEEANELRCEMRDDAPASAKAIEEAADVLIVLCGWAGRNDVDLIGAVMAKFQIVKARNQKARDIERGIPVS